MHRTWGLPAAGAVAVAGLAWYTAVSVSPAIEQDLLLRSSAALRDAGIEIPPNGLQIEGQTARLSGAPGAPIVSEDAARRIGAVWGITEVIVSPWGLPIAPATAAAVPLPPPAPTSSANPASPPAKPVVDNKLQQDLTGHTIAFRGATDVLLPQSRAVLDGIARILRAAPRNTVVEIGAHTDADGDANKNLSLSKRRAASVRRYLQSRGVAQSHLKDVGYGQTKPIAPNDTDSNKARNRRVEFLVLPNAGRQ